MNRVRLIDLTPEARIDAAKRKLADAIADLVSAERAEGAAQSEPLETALSRPAKRCVR